MFYPTIDSLLKENKKYVAARQFLFTTLLIAVANFLLIPFTDLCFPAGVAIINMLLLTGKAVASGNGEEYNVYTSATYGYYAAVICASLLILALLFFLYFYSKKRTWAFTVTFVLFCIDLFYSFSLPYIGLDFCNLVYHICLIVCLAKGLKSAKRLNDSLPDGARTTKQGIIDFFENKEKQAREAAAKSVRPLHLQTRCEHCGAARPPQYSPSCEYCGSLFDDSPKEKNSGNRGNVFEDF